MRSSTAQPSSEASRHDSPRAPRSHLFVFTSAEVRGGEHDRDPRAKTKHGQDAGHANSSAIRVAEDAAVRRFAAVGCGGGAPQRTSTVAEGTSSIEWTTAAGTCTGSSSADTGSCTVTMSAAKSLVAKLE